MSITHRAGAAAMALAALAAGPAGAQSGDRPQPTSCAGLSYEDPAGDQSVSFATVAGQQVKPNQGKPKDNLDIIRGFFRYAPQAGGANRMTAVVELTNVTKELEPNSNGVVWYVYFNVGDAVRFVAANLSNAGDVTYTYGTQLANRNAKDGDTTGRFVEGPDGYIAIDVPVGEMGLEGQTLTEVNGQARAAFNTPAGGLVVLADRGPDSGAGADFEVVPCAEEGKATTARQDQTPANDRPAGGGSTTTTSGGGEQSTSGGGGTTVAGITPIKLRVIAGRLSARKVSRSRKLSVRLLPGEPISGLRATLYTGKPAKPKVFATGRVAKLTKARTLTLRTKRKLKAGTYTLAFTGRNAAGQTSTVSVKLRVRR
jgi:hypothetical protein